MTGRILEAVLEAFKKKPPHVMQVHKFDEENSMVTDYRWIDISHMYNMKWKNYIIHIQMYITCIYVYKPSLSQVKVKKGKDLDISE